MSLILTRLININLYFLRLKNILENIKLDKEKCVEEKKMLNIMIQSLNGKNKFKNMFFLRIDRIKKSVHR